MTMPDVDPLFGDTATPAAPADTSRAPAAASASQALVPTAVVTPAVIASLPSDTDVDNLGSAGRETYAQITQRLLETHKTGDAGEMGKQLNELIVTAKGLDPKHRGHGFFGAIVHAFKSEKELILAHTESVQTRIHELTKQMDQSAATQRQRIQDLQAMLQGSYQYHEQLKTAVEQAESWLPAIHSAMQAPVDTKDPFAAQKGRELKQRDQRLQIRINDLKNAMVLAQQQAVEIGATQDNARAILDEFDRAKNEAIPALTALVAQQLIAIEQKNALAIDATLRSTVQNAMTQAAQTLGENMETIATMQQSAVISTDTLDQCQKLLEASAAKVKQIEAQGAQQRVLDAQKRQDLEKRLLQQIQNP
jgi:uncharacterized protein YaaN involved in tellurite resistance